MWGHGKALLSLAQSLQIGDRVKLLPMASPLAMVELAGEYDIGLAVETEGSENHRRCLANKIFTYLLAGRPILMSDTPAQQALAGELGEAAAVVSLADPAAIARQLDRWALAPEPLQAAGRTACRLARNRYNWQIEQRIFLASVAKAFDSEGHRSCIPSS
jgi:glycosyltransferase involved in cell wall biosynthesis